MKTQTLGGKRAPFLFGQLLRTLNKLKFDRIPTEREIVRHKLKKPNVKRIKETQHQTSFRREIDGYTIVVHTSYDEKLKRFTDAGRIWILITVPVGKKRGTKRLFETFFYRDGECIKKTKMMVEFLVDRLNKRPVGEKDKRLMELHRTDEATYEWRSASGKKEASSFYTDVPKHLQDFIFKQITSRNYYANFGRKQRGVKTPARFIRKTWMPGKQKNVA